MLYLAVGEAEEDVDTAEDEDGDDVGEEAVMILSILVPWNLLEHLVVVVMAEGGVEDNDEDDGDDELDWLEQKAGGQGRGADGLQGATDDKEVGVAQEDLGQL